MILEDFERSSLHCLINFMMPSGLLLPILSFSIYTLLCQSIRIHVKNAAPFDFVNSLVANAQEVSRVTDYDFSSNKAFTSDEDLLNLQTTHRDNTHAYPSSEAIPSEEPIHDDSGVMKEELKKQLFALLDKRKGTYQEYFEEEYASKNCNSVSMMPDGAITISWLFNGSTENMAYSDPNHGFFRYAMGFSKDQIEESMYVFLKHVKIQFGVDFNFKEARFEKEHGGYKIESKHMRLVPFVNVFHSRISAYSGSPISCADMTSVNGGWLLTAGDDEYTVYGKVGGQQGIKYSTNVSFLNLFFVFMHGKRKSTRLGVYPMLPMADTNEGYYPFTGVGYNFDDDFMGWVDGLSASYVSEQNEYTNIFRATYMWPGRFSPMANFKE